MTMPAEFRFTAHTVPACQFMGYQIALIAPETEDQSHVKQAVEHFFKWYEAYVTDKLKYSEPAPIPATCGWCGGQGYVEGSVGMRPYRIPCFRCNKRGFRT